MKSTEYELLAYATKRKVRRPKPECILTAAKAKSKPEPKANPKAVNKGKTCSADGCEKAAVTKGMCTADYTRLIYRADPAKKEKAREASRRYAAKKHAEREAAKAAAEKEATA